MELEWKPVPMSGLEALQILFIALKLLNKIDWSWWWVLSPLWILATIAIVLLVISWLINR